MPIKLHTVDPASEPAKLIPRIGRKARSVSDPKIRRKSAENGRTRADCQTPAPSSFEPEAAGRRVNALLASAAQARPRGGQTVSEGRRVAPVAKRPVEGDSGE